MSESAAVVTSSPASQHRHSADTDDPRWVTITIVLTIVTIITITTITTIVTMVTMCRCVPGGEMRSWQVARTSLGFLYPVYRWAG